MSRVTLNSTIAAKQLEAAGFYQTGPEKEGRREFVLIDTAVSCMLREERAGMAIRFYPASCHQAIVQEWRAFEKTHLVADTALVSGDVYLMTEAALIAFLRHMIPFARRWRPVDDGEMGADGAGMDGRLVPDDFDPAHDPVTETERIRHERRGQAVYREALEVLWGGKCAVTGIGLRELLRASHARAWKDCENGRQRLDPYNGFLLNVALDALFDSYRISFDDTGHILIDPELSLAGLALLGISHDMKLRFLAPEHLPYLAWHRACCAWLRK